MRNILWSAVLISAIDLHAQVAVSPTAVELSPKTNIGEIILSNMGTEERMFEISVKAWSQNGSDERFGETEDVLVLPKAVTLKSKSKQKLRVILQKPAPERTSTFYRIFVKEVSTPTINFSGLRFLLSINMPVFSRGQAFKENSRPTWSIVVDRGQKYLSLANKGKGHIVVHDLNLLGKKPAQLASMQYVLPNNEIRWPLPKELEDAKNIDFKFSVDGKNKKISLESPQPKKITVKNQS